MDFPNSHWGVSSQLSLMFFSFSFYRQLFKRSYWSYTKSMIRQPLTVRIGLDEEDFDETSLKLFHSILQHAG